MRPSSNTVPSNAALVVPPDPARRDGSTKTHGQDAPAAAPRPVARRYRAAGVLLAAALLVALGFFFGGFLNFTAAVSRVPLPDHLVRADGIVALTGGADRVAGAVGLLTGGHARRLLISGVHPETSASQIGRVVEAGPSLFDCCVDLDRRAANTIGNATETAKWVRRNGFTSLIVVTSAYHMPRALAELAHAMPEVRLIAYPIARPTLELDRWYGNGGTLALLMEEYVKYIASVARLGLAGDGDAVMLTNWAR